MIIKKSLLPDPDDERQEKDIFGIKQFSLPSLDSSFFKYEMD